MGLNPLAGVLALGFASACVWAAEPPTQAGDLAPMVTGGGRVAQYKLADLPATFHAYRIAVPGDGGVSDVFSGPRGRMLLAFSTASSHNREGILAQLIATFDLYWTDGAIVSRSVPGGTPSEAYLATYRVDLALGDYAKLIEHPERAADLALTLHFLKLSTITSIVPEPTYTKESVGGSIASIVAEAAKLPTAREQSARTIALSNVKQLATALAVYLADNDDWYPSVQSTAELKTILAPYTKNASIWDTQNPKSRFLFNMSLSGANSNDIQSPAETPTIYESEPDAYGIRVVAFADGHASRLNADKWLAASKLLKLKLPKHNAAGRQKPKEPTPGRAQPGASRGRS